MRYRAVVFDFFGTLTVAGSPQRRAAALDEIALAIGAPVEEFRTLWWSTWPERCTGAMGGFTAALRDVDARLGVQASDQALGEATELRRSSERRFRALRHD